MSPHRRGTSMDSLPVPALAAPARPGRRANLKRALTALASAILLALALRHVDAVALGRSLAGANYWLVAVAAAVYFVDLGLRSLRWRVLLGVVCPVSWRRLYPVLTIGYMANNLLPARLGELTRAYLVGRREQISASTVLASVALERVLDGVVVVGLLVMVLPSLPRTDWLGPLMRAAGLTFGAGLGVCLSLAVAQPAWLGVLIRRAGWVPPALSQRVATPLRRFLAGLGVLRSPGALVQTTLLSIAIWGVGAVIYLLVAAAFGTSLSVVGAIAAICIVNLATAVPLAPAGLGAFEVAAVAVFTLLGMSETMAAGVTIVLHAVLVVPVVAAGLIFLWRLNLSLGSLWADPRPSKREPLPGRQE